MRGRQSCAPALPGALMVEVNTKQGGRMCGDLGIRSLDSEDPKHTLFYREMAFVAIHVLFRDGVSIL